MPPPPPPPPACKFQSSFGVFLPLKNFRIFWEVFLSSKILNLFALSLCVRRELGFCTISYTPTEADNAFRVNNDVNSAIAVTGSAFCSKDAVFIAKSVSPGSECLATAFAGMRKNQKDVITKITTDSVDRFCANNLSCISNTKFLPGERGTVTSTMGSPFIVSFQVSWYIGRRLNLGNIEMTT